jgi:nucleoside-diphosphate-sugar epimerase
MPRALVTGATSYIGLVVLRQLLAAGWDVCVLARQNSDISRLPGNFPANNVLRMDGSADQLTGLVEVARPDVVFHFASLYLREPSPEQVPEMLAANITFGMELLEALRRTGRPASFVNAGTGTQYFHSATPNPLNLYAATKQAFADMLDFYTRTENLTAVSLILFDTFGPEDWRVKLLNAMYDAHLSEDELSLPEDDAELDLLYIEDAAAAFVQAGSMLLTDPGTLTGGPYALSSGERQTISGIVAKWTEICGKPLKVKWGDYDLPERRTRTLWQGPALPGWQPETSFKQGLQKFLSQRKA